MSWFEIFALFFFLGGMLTCFIILVFNEVQRMREAIRCLKKEQEFYDIAGEWFNDQLNK